MTLPLSNTISILVDTQMHALVITVHNVMWCSVFVLTVTLVTMTPVTMTSVTMTPVTTVVPVVVKTFMGTVTSVPGNDHNDNISSSK